MIVLYLGCGLLMSSFVLIYISFLYKLYNRKNDDMAIWKKSFSLEKNIWILSIVFFCLGLICIIKFSTKSIKDTCLYLGYAFILIHMLGEWFFTRCDFEIERHNTFQQYLIDNILGSLIIKPNEQYEVRCDSANKIRHNSIIINRNLSIFFLTVYIILLNYT